MNKFEFEGRGNGFFTHRQWAAVTIHWLLIIEPPQIPSPSKRSTCHGQLFALASIPPTIFKPNSLGLITGMPQTFFDKFTFQI